MPQVVDSSNLIEFTQTGKVAEFKAPTPAPAPADGKGAPATPVETKGEPPAQSRGADGKFTKPGASDTTTTASPSAVKADDDEKDLSEVVRQKINAKHRQAKEAEERERRETLRAIEAERRAEQLQRDLEAERRKSGPPSAPEAPKEPKAEDFKTVAEYTDALVSYRVDQRLREKAEQEARDAEQRTIEERNRAFTQKMGEAITRYPDFDVVLDSIKGTELDNVHKDVIQYIQHESEVGPDLLYHLAKNPDVMRRLQKLPPKRFIAELGKLEVKWEKQPAGETKALDTPSTLTGAAATTAPPVSKAPAPIAPLESSGIAPATKDPKDMSVAELRDYRQQQEREKRSSRSR